jgi:hypothetical protein
MDAPATPERSRAIKAYRDMAESCRKMAASSRRPQSLILRAQAFEETARALERGDEVSAKGE